MWRSDKRRNDDNNFNCRNALAFKQHARGGDDSAERSANINGISSGQATDNVRLCLFEYLMLNACRRRA